MQRPCGGKGWEASVVSTVGGWPWGQIGGAPRADIRFRGNWSSRTSHSQTPRDQKRLQEAQPGTRGVLLCSGTASRAHCIP